MNFEDFCEKDVINICDCKKLGKVVSLDFDECDGCIRKILIQEKQGLLGIFCSSAQIEIEYGRIKRIGPDLIFVEV